MMVMNTGVRMSKANVLSGLEDMHQQSVECITQFTDIKGTSQKAYSFFEESLESMRALERCIDEARELMDVLDYCMNETATAEKDVEKYIGLSATPDNSASGNLSNALPSQNTDGNILPKYTANLPEGTGTSGIETSWGYQQVGVNSGTVAEFNTEALDVSCTFTTLYQLHKKNLGFPFNGRYGTDGTNWFNLYAGNSEDKYAGASGLRNLIDEYKASEQTADLENIVVSFSGGWENHGHVLLIDHISKDGIITFKDQSGPDGSPLIADDFSTTSAMEAINNDEKCPWQSLNIDDFEKKYKDVGLTMNGAILIGTPQ